jgi:hypothetical protein
MRRTTGLLAALLFAGALVAPAAEPDPDLADAEEALRAARVGTDAAALLSRNAERFTRLPATLRAAQPRGMGKSFCAPT